MNLGHSTKGKALERQGEARFWGVYILYTTATTTTRTKSIKAKQQLRDDRGNRLDTTQSMPCGAFGVHAPPLSGRRRGKRLERQRKANRHQHKNGECALGSCLRAANPLCFLWIPGPNDQRDPGFSKDKTDQGIPQEQKEIKAVPRHLNLTFRLASDHGLWNVFDTAVV